MKNLKDDLKRLETYLSYLKNLKEAPTPAKHKHRVAAYRQMLDFDMSGTKSRIESIKMELANNNDKGPKTSS